MEPGIGIFSIATFTQANANKIIQNEPRAEVISKKLELTLYIIYFIFFSLREYSSMRSLCESKQIFLKIAKLYEMIDFHKKSG